MSEMLTIGFLVSFLIATVRASIPILLAASGEIYSERSGVVNINLEGQMLMGAFFGFLTAYLTGSLFLGTVAAALVGVVFAMLFGFACITRKASQIVVGITLNILALGLTSFLNRAFFGTAASLPRVDVYPVLPVPLLHHIPYLGAILFRHNGVIYGSVALALVSYVVINKTTFGLELRSAGEYPRAAETMGINVFRMQYLALVVCGALAGMGGAYLTLGMLGRFMEGISAGRGFIALALVIFAKWHPVKLIAAALVFGGANALQMRMQAYGIGIPYQIMLMLPYIVTVIILIITGTKTTAPAALGVPYEREQL